ncbi:MAG: hypothetical protein HZB76_05155 [Chlamydiae bacterium]|nr:hypothetical protein [Chlamydiota bacterium]
MLLFLPEIPGPLPPPPKCSINCFINPSFISTTPKRLGSYTCLTPRDEYFSFNKGLRFTSKIVSPSIINIGSEEKKGTVEIRKAYQELQKKSLLNNNFIFAGNIEGKEVFEGSIDVLVTDGFTGNVFLKTAEGTASFILQHFYSQMPEKDPAIKTFLADLENRLHYTEYPGAILCGVDGIVIKCHSYSTTVEIVSGIKGAINLVESNFLERLKTFLKNP